MKTFYKKRIFNIFIIVIIAFLLLTLCLNPEKYAKTCLSGVILWATAVMPTLLPFFFLTAILSSLNELSRVFSKTNKFSYPLLNTSGLGLYAFFMSAISGYPVGASIVQNLYESNLIDYSESNKIARFSSTSGPLFIIGVVGVNMFKNKNVGLYLYIIHVLSAIILGIIFKGKSSRKTKPVLPRKTTDNILNTAMYNSITSVLIVGGFITIFYVFSNILIDYNIFNPLIYILTFIFKPLNLTSEVAKGLIVGVLETTNGCNLLASFSVTPLTLGLTSFILSFGGISIIMQTYAFLSKVNIPLKTIFINKFLQGVISFILAYCFTFLL